MGKRILTGTFQVLLAKMKMIAPINWSAKVENAPVIDRNG
jgi:hypothetical protein